MSTHRGSRRSIAAWLEAEAADRAPTRLIEASRQRVRTTPQRTGWWPTRWVSNRSTFATLGVAAAAVVVAVFGVVGLTQLRGPVIDPAGISPSPTPQPSAAASSPAVPASPAPQTSGRMWPQSTDEEVRRAQERADAGDPAYTWQVDPNLYSEDVDLTRPVIVERFLREVLGWDTFLYNVRESNLDVSIGSRRMGLMYLRCAPGDPNPLYTIADEQALGAERCAPTIDDLHYESVRFNIDQPERKGPAAVWVVGEWEVATFTQLDPRVAENEVTAQLEEWLAARIAGEGAEGKIDLHGGRCGGRYGSTCTIDEVPLLYGTTSGASYERYEIERVGAPRWPYAEMEFTVRLFGDDGATVVEQPISWIDTQMFDGRAGLALLSDVMGMTENGQPVAVPFVFGEVTASAAPPWVVSHTSFNYGLSLNDVYGGEGRVAFVPDPRLVTAGCQAGSAPADAVVLAQGIRSDSNFEATAPVDVVVGGAKALHIDVTLAPGASVCPDDDGRSSVVTSQRVLDSWLPALDHGSRMRLYLVDLPEGSAAPILAIAIVAPQARFESVVEAAAPVVESVEFRAP